MWKGVLGNKEDKTNLENLFQGRSEFPTHSR
jgi:hypothetical protein